jgi:hypothetical protein
VGFLPGYRPHHPLWEQERNGAAYAEPVGESLVLVPEAA